MLKVVLSDTLDRYDITNHKLAIEADLRPNTVHDFAKGNSKRIDLETLNKMLIGLNKIAINRHMNIRFDLSDIMQFEFDGYQINFFANPE